MYFLRDPKEATVSSQRIYDHTIPKGSSSGKSCYDLQQLAVSATHLSYLWSPLRPPSLTPSGAHTCSRQGGRCSLRLQVSWLAEQLRLLPDAKAMVPSAMLHTPSESNPVQTSRGLSWIPGLHLAFILSCPNYPVSCPHQIQQPLHCISEFRDLGYTQGGKVRSA